MTRSRWKSWTHVKTEYISSRPLDAFSGADDMRCLRVMDKRVRKCFAQQTSLPERGTARESLTHGAMACDLRDGGHLALARHQCTIVHGRPGFTVMVEKQSRDKLARGMVPLPTTSPSSLRSCSPTSITTSTQHSPPLVLLLYLTVSAERMVYHPTYAGHTPRIDLGFAP